MMSTRNLLLSVTINLSKKDEPMKNQYLSTLLEIDLMMRGKDSISNFSVFF